MDFNYELLYISLITLFVFCIPFIGLIIYKQLKKYNIQKNDVLIGINISKTMIAMVNSLLVEYGFSNNKVKLLSDIILKSIDYLISTKADVTDDVKIKEGVKMVKELLWGQEISLSSYEENVVENIIRVGINLVGK